MQIEEPVQLQFHCYRKGKTGIKKYIGYVRANQLDLIKENLQIPKHSLPIQLQTHIKWEVQEEERNGKKYYKIHSFKFQQVKVINGNPITKITTFFGEEEDLIKLKEALRNKIIFQRIQDFYTPLQTLGKGASSRVLLVRHKNTEKFYAAKCVDKSYVNETENGLESMFQEISINNALEHSSFIKLHAVYEGDNTFYMVMDLLEGRSLHEELGNNKDGYSEDTVRNIMWQILSGIEYMHQKEIMHRDLKPENIMLLKKGDLNSLKIVDFGLATYCNIEKYLFPKCGTPGYVAPEIANLIDKTLKYDKVCDIFSAGVIFFKLITGKDLFPGVGFNLVLKLNKQCKIDLTPLQIKKVDPQIIGLIQKMLEKDPQQRITATGCLQDPFFIQCYQETPIQGPQKLTPFQKKQQFSFSGKAVTQDFVIDGQKVSPVNEQEKQGSFVTQDNAYKSVEQPHLKQQKMMHKFNTTEFDHVVQTPSPNVQNKLQNFQKHDPIEEEDEK